jgi:hypothetical protein
VAGLRRQVLAAGQRIALSEGAAGGAATWVQEAVAALLRPPGSAAAPLATQAAAQAATPPRAQARGAAPGWSVRTGPRLAHGAHWPLGPQAGLSPSARTLRRP